MRPTRKLVCVTCKKEGFLQKGLCVKCGAIAYLKRMGRHVDSEPLDVDGSRERQWKALDVKLGVPGFWRL